MPHLSPLFVYSVPDFAITYCRMVASGNDLLDQDVDVYDLQSGEAKPIGALTISIVGKELIKSLRLK